MNENNQIIIYQTEDGQTQVDVRMANDTVWLTQAQMAELFNKDQSVIARHIANVFKEGELEKESNMQILHNTLSKYKPTAIYNLDVINNVFKEGELNQKEVCAKIAHTTRHGAMDGKTQVQEVFFYNLDVIISVGYRVKSQRGVKFRQWANKVLKDFLLKGAALQKQFSALENRIDRRLSQYDKRLDAHERQIDFFIQSNLPPKQGIFFDGQIYDAYTFVADLVRKAQRRIVLIDNYIDDTVLTLLDKRMNGVDATIYTSRISQQLQLDITRHNSQYPAIDVRTFSKTHDRFLITDDKVYLIGASIKDLGKKWFGFTLMENTDAEELLGRI